MKEIILIFRALLDPSQLILIVCDLEGFVPTDIAVVYFACFSLTSLIANVQLLSLEAAKMFSNGEILSLWIND